MTGRALRAHTLSWLVCGIFLACSSSSPAPQTDAEGDVALNAAALGSGQSAPSGTTGTLELAVGSVAADGSGGDAGTEPEQPFVAAADAGNAWDLCPDIATSYVTGEWSPYQPEIPAGGEPARALLQGVQAVMTGSWRGLVNTPWTSPYVVDITFSPDGHYSARCAEQEEYCCLAFYYGTDVDTPLKQWRVDDATLSGNVFGEIDIAFGGGGQFGLPSWQGQLSHIERDASGNGLRFEFATSRGHGPLRYDLRRVQ